MKTYERIYQRLLKENFITGETLARELDISRAAVWKAIKTLEDNGIQIEAIKKRGYRILSGDLLLPDVISNALNLPVSYLVSSESTQQDAKTAALNGAQAPHLYLAPNQTAARGRLGRHFHADKNGGIYMTLHLKPNASYDKLPPYTVLVASSIVKAISRLTDKSPEIKWVNDIFLDGKKIAGILSEAVTSVETGLVTDVFIGIGLNFHISTFPNELDGIAASLFTETPNITRNDLICEIWKLFFNIPEHDHIKVYKEKSLVLHKQVTYEKDNQVITAKVSDITDQGHLILETTDGQTLSLASGEVSLSSW
ncbi:bifunctional biotin--[acetyl-CoA-carboxylase] ligase/biotin operon repressor BirA [Streptococcus pluranimalium]|uniref:bifunctional biotin--[acetyl-CoA-carboxylase] ligase/biotin operon repressor BirA n=1 Tax=Streptococcus pluranimalium TaxID=82348 RepID=UPI00292ED5E9|nr:bifunctional biotin--[acetyl-CoA-carboxylase] ligase/biotin operon repressor BirA [Streptococcus pluranimalium]MDY3042001.1 bifunctional biotin--[acetyl-CoA-carboxylase] ligase/biotin operon repressor BirA [Streptococcus pluranimalium]HEM6115971.1 bifunctional biotin--[acetyl-CoA-carboxylase] ligase/biotin operon repressor BirA [Streptococcus suis]